MHLIPVDESLCESALRITQAISQAFKWCLINGLHQEVPCECGIMDDANTVQHARQFGFKHNESKPKKSRYGC